MIALCQAECIASYSVEVTVKSSGNSTRKATVMSASLLTIQPCSMESRGNFDSRWLSCFYFSFVRFLWLKITDKVADRTAVHKVAWVHTHCSFLHQPILPVLSIHGERLPYHKAGTHYTYDKTGNLADATEIENDHKNEDGKQASCKEEEILCLQALELHRPTYTFVDFKCCHRLTGRNFSG